MKSGLNTGLLFYLYLITIKTITNMSYSFKQIQTEANANSTKANNPISELYPPTKLEGDVTTITGFIKGASFTDIKYLDKNGKQYMQFVFTKKNSEGGEKLYTMLQSNFLEFNFSSEEAKKKSIAINIQNILNIFKVYDIEVDEDKIDFDNFEDLFNIFKSYLEFPVDSEESMLKVVFQKDSGEKAQYNVSSNHPVVAKPLFLDDKIKFTDRDRIVFTKVKADMDDMLAGNTNMDLNSLM